mmetsp:Transcript_58337/g.139314  ORF Transcript_58337/g.139314 Transcript_58337/m.139314 type:complete len:191 (-) Transcript_58337:12-584(-)
MASWLFGGGSELDLSAAERAIKQLSEDRDEVKAQVSELEKKATAQQRRMEALKQKLSEAEAAKEVARAEGDAADREAHGLDEEIRVLRTRLVQSHRVFDVQDDLEKINLAFNQARFEAFPIPLVVAGPHGSGRSVLISKLFEDFGWRVALPISHTSRPPREGEVHGAHYHFVSREQLELLAREGKVCHHS